MILKDRLPDRDLHGMEQLLTRDTFSQRDRSLLHFGLAAVYDARAEYFCAAEHLVAANAHPVGCKGVLGHPLGSG